MEFFKPGTNIDFMGTKRTWILISLILCGISLMSLVTPGLKFGTDFAGGTEFQVLFKEAIDSAAVRQLMEAGGYKDSSVQHFGREDSREFLIHIEQASDSLEAVTQNMTSYLTTQKGAGNFEVKKVDMVGPKVGADLKKRGLWAVIYALLGIFIYVALRFDYRFSPGGIIALIHDILITLGAFAILGKKFDLTVLAAILTIAGYSINDTIVVFDRIREQMKLHQGMDIVQIINRAINDTLSRTILTNFTAILAVIILYMFGGEVIHDFSFALLVGFIVGTYSSIFIASPVFHYLYVRGERKTG